MFGVKMDIDGNVIWMNHWGDEYEDLGHDVIECPDGGFIIPGLTMSHSSGFNSALVL